MQVSIDYEFEVGFLPSKRHRKVRKGIMSAKTSFDIDEAQEAGFPLAFIVTDYEHIANVPPEKSFAPVDTDVRAFGARLFKRAQDGNAWGNWYASEDAKGLVEAWGRGWYSSWDKEELTPEAIILDSTQDGALGRLRDKAGSYIVFNGQLWESCGEPMYNIDTFGLGHNHGGTGFFISWRYNGNISHRNYFNALQREEAIAYGKQVAANRGDTESIDRIGKYDNIEVLMPELVKRNPAVEHGDGDPFMNSMETLISGSGSSTEAGLLVMAATAEAIAR